MQGVALACSIYIDTKTTQAMQVQRRTERPSHSASACLCLRQDADNAGNLHQKGSLLSGGQ